MARLDLVLSRRHWIVHMRIRRCSYWKRLRSRGRGGQRSSVQEPWLGRPKSYPPYSYPKKPLHTKHYFGVYADLDDDVQGKKANLFIGVDTPPLKRDNSHSMSDRV